MTSFMDKNAVPHPDFEFDAPQIPSIKLDTFRAFKVPLRDYHLAIFYFLALPLEASTSAPSEVLTRRDVSP